jgi:ribosomal protein S18 acetylase RimI-like enzyme
MTIMKETILKDGRLLVLRKARISDAQRILGYLNTVGGESNNLMFGKNGCNLTIAQEAEHLSKLGSSPNTLLLIGLVGREMVSLSQARGETPQRAAHNFQLSITVRKPFWGLGIGSASMAELIHFSRERGVRALHLGVRAGNEVAIKLYEKFGFERVGMHRGFFNIDGVFHDEILMDLYLG